MLRRRGEQIARAKAHLRKPLPKSLVASLVKTRAANIRNGVGRPPTNKKEKTNG